MNDNTNEAMEIIDLISAADLDRVVLKQKLVNGDEIHLTQNLSVSTEALAANLNLIWLN